MRFLFLFPLLLLLFYSFFCCKLIRREIFFPVLIHCSIVIRNNTLLQIKKTNDLRKLWSFYRTSIEILFFLYFPLHCSQLLLLV